MADLIMPRVVKRSGTSQPFDEEKLRNSMRIAIQKCSVSMEQLEEAIQRISHDIRTTGERELPSRIIGEMVMKELRNLDQVAYVRFASVYRSFQDVAEFSTEIERLQKNAGEREHGEN
jgi:transcriptional repressor NrdR